MCVLMHVCFPSQDLESMLNAANYTLYDYSIMH